MLFHVLSKFHGVNATEGDLLYAESGKPYLKNHPVEFNITHTDGLVMIAVSDDGEVGVDAEYLYRDNDAEKIAEKYFFPQEREQIKTRKHFFTLWTKKESAIKYASLTIASSLKKTTFIGETPVGEDKYADAKTRSYAFDDYVYSVTAKSPDHELVFVI